MPTKAEIKRRKLEHARYLAERRAVESRARQHRREAEKRRKAKAAPIPRMRVESSPARDVQIKLRREFYLRQKLQHPEGWKLPPEGARRQK